ncbi:MAG: heavy metal translocating P-type ATPase metal-binding domain-containing protein [Bacteroidia bacterium]|jgi:Cu+-exporting ATPase|nr:heavy metal translocating P-type ATPase metal-binding domain-containing protein [Bacteroidia bacterium]
MKIAETAAATTCYHCGEDLKGSALKLDNRPFCCEGCKTVYEILSQNNMADYYRLNATPGKNGRSADTVKEKYAWLDDPQFSKELIQFTDGDISTITFQVPAIHCSSCIWLLENLWKLHPGVVRTQVNFLRREAHVTFREKTISLRQLAELLHRIGYAPDLRAGNAAPASQPHTLRHWYYRLGVAFFCFGNIMLLSFPEYFGVDALAESEYRNFFGYLNFLLSLPVLFYSSAVFFRSAWSGLRSGVVNMDVPIVLGIVVMFLRSSWEIFSHSGAGYMDTLASLVFLMLIGRLFQNKTYDRLSFERDYKSYFPMAVTVLRNGSETSIPVANIRKGDRLLIRSEELLPADSILMQGSARMDYSFVTGESAPAEKVAGEILYAGGRQKGSAIEVEVIREVSQSYLTRLWNDAAFRKAEPQDVTSLAGRISKTFTFVVFAIAAGAALYWFSSDAHRALNAFTAVLIITCPCALAISSPFTLGNMLRLFGRKGVYLKNTGVVETLAGIDTVIFDKTGTMTQSGDTGVQWEGEALNDNELAAVRTLARQSGHPLSQKLYAGTESATLPQIGQFEEHTGKGIAGKAGDYEVKLGSARFVAPEQDTPHEAKTAAVYIGINGKLRGRFLFGNRYRQGLEELVNELRGKYKLGVLSGDNNAEEAYITQLFGHDATIGFNQSPADKLAAVRTLQQQGRKVLMIGDGLNDAGALKQSDAGLSISDDINNFSPACDGIVDAQVFRHIPALLHATRKGKRILMASFGLSFLYNIVGLWFAVQGNLSPLVAAILMPVSSVTIILFTTIASRINVNGTLAAAPDSQTVEQ